MGKTNPNSKKLGDPNVKTRVTMHNGVHAVIFKSKDYNGVMAEECKYTLIGKFVKTRPNIERSRSSFVEKISLKSTPKIGTYDYRTVFIEVSNEEDCQTIWFRRSIEIDGMVMWLQKWNSDFKPEEDSPIVPVWVLLPGLLFHFHPWNYVKKILRPIGIPLSPDLATENRTRPNMAKVRVEVDLTKPRLNQIWVGQEDEANPLKGFYQKIEYEGVPKYCRHCKILGHSVL
ncbi:uncharacterized protein LOC132048688 [Lycium ferocissimum]|uniref:uncharacterized protein LOC132048688 n=1 Tax=Lycium ferocissimum TaxID=112874 RepID=UPI002815B5D4|nr:uncharacterized protein LOC132048688 [Lycium ferocissimum]